MAVSTSLRFFWAEILEFAEDRENISEDDHIGIGSG